MKRNLLYLCMLMLVTTQCSYYQRNNYSEETKYVYEPPWFQKYETKISVNEQVEYVRPRLEIRDTRANLIKAYDDECRILIKHKANFDLEDCNTRYEVKVYTKRNGLIKNFTTGCASLYNIDGKIYLTPPVDGPTSAPQYVAITPEKIKVFPNGWNFASPNEIDFQGGQNYGVNNGNSIYK